MSAIPSARGFAAVIVAAGKGERAGLGVPKQFAQFRGKPVVRHSVERLIEAGGQPVLVAIPPDAEEQALAALKGLPVELVAGGVSRQQSVGAALEALAGRSPDFVLIHDAARPDLPESVIDRLLKALESHSGAIPVLPVVDSLVRASGELMEERASRETLHRVQTPQAFRFADILAAHRAWQAEANASDDAQLLHAAGGDVVLIAGDTRLAKLTFPEDFVADNPMVRTGLGYDVHRLAAGEDLWLGGIRIEHYKGLVGHSDADVALHALVDAILGALGQGDIGTHFPPSDAEWKGADSAMFLSYAAELAGQSGYGISSVDLTIICERPRIGPYREAMRERIATLLSIDLNRVSVKATTTEGLGFAGRGEGIAAQAIATIQAISGVR